MQSFTKTDIALIDLKQAAIFLLQKQDYSISKENLVTREPPLNI